MTSRSQRQMTHSVQQDGTTCSRKREAASYASLAESFGVSPTPAMTLIDVDGTLPPADLAAAGAEAAARAILRHDIGGSIGIDLPTVAGKAQRQRIGELVDAILPQPFERTAVNGFGFLQIVRPRRRASLFELAADRPAFEARALLRRAAMERTGATRSGGQPRRRRLSRERAGLARNSGEANRRGCHLANARPSFPSMGPMPRTADSKTCPICRKPASRRACTVLLARVQGPRPLEMARRGLSHRGPASRRPSEALGGVDSEERDS